MIKAQLNSKGELTTDEIQYIVNNTDNSKISDNNRYFKGTNPTITDQAAPTDSNTPDNRVPIPYGRKISLTTKNYMFSKPVNYVSEDKEHMNKINDVFFVNQNKRKIDEIGQDLIVFGVAYKLFSYDQDESKQTIPKYSRLNPYYCFPVYDYSTDPQLIAFIYYYIVGEDVDSDYETYINVYYKDHIVKYKETGTVVTEGMIEQDNKAHGFNDIPVVVYSDKNYNMGVFDAVKPIIDGIDKIASTDLNEIDKFNLAYLVLKGQTIATDDLDDIKEKRLFELDQDATLEYLTKQLDGVFNGNVLAFLVSEVHKQSGVPDFASQDFAAESGIALQYKLIGFEGIASDYESIFIEGELKSIDLINSILYRDTKSRFEFAKAFPTKQIEIQMHRNLPEELTARLAEANQMSMLGISLETILDKLSFIPDVAEEIKRIDEQKKKNIEEFGSFGTNQNDNADDKNTDNKDNKDGDGKDDE